jgi:hypothetical protein
MPWSTPFEDPIPLPRGQQLVTLQDAADYIMKLPKADQAVTESQTAVGCLIGAAEGRDFLMHARWHAAGAQSQRGTGVRHVAERNALGQAKIKEGRVTSLDNWPMPKFDAGDTKHLHAVGVISVTFVQFEKSVESMFLHHPAHSAVPFEFLERYFLALSEDQRVAETRKFYSDSEPDALIRDAAKNALDFFDWARDSRNKILHSERYPMGFGADPDVFYLTKRASKRDPSSRYMALDLPTLRSTAEHMRAGIVRSAEINIHVRYRNSSDLSKIPQSLWVYAKSNDFPALAAPPRIVMTERPER